MVPVRAFALAVGLVIASTAAFADAPTAVVQDPPIDYRAPASGQGVRFESHGANVNAQLYRPAGAGIHPCVVLLHGLPGNEQNLDLARAVQRAGWTVVTFHYRGSWGSGGTFSLKGGAEDIDALLDLLQQAEKASAWGIDPKHIVVMGHSYGGYVAAHAAATRPGILAVGLLAPWDPSDDARRWAKLSDAERLKAIVGDNNDIDGRLGAVTAAEIVRQIMQDGPELDLAKLAPALSTKRILVVTATHDDPNDKAISLLPALRAKGVTQLAASEFETDHGFNDHRIALTTLVVNWLSQLPDAPKP